MDKTATAATAATAAATQPATEDKTTAAASTAPAQEAQAQGEATQENNALTAEAIERIVQQRVDKITAELGKKNANLQKELSKVKKEKLSEEEIQKLELADREKAITEKEQALTERENRLFAIREIKEIGLDDGSQMSLDLVDFVMAADEETITERVKTFKALVDRFVSAKVDGMYKSNGRNPESGSKGASKGTSSIAAELGKKTAETQQKSNETLKHYFGG